MKLRLTTIAVLIPLAGLLVLVARAELAVRHGVSWVIPIEGYDPRDLLHGRYLQYRYRFDWQGYGTCGTGEYEPTPGCCLCLTRDEPDGYDPAVRQLECDEALQMCDGVIRSEEVLPPLRYLVPEGAALPLEDALRTRPAALEITIDPSHAPAIRELWLEGRPWREAID